ncbi:pickpocket protein 28-like [Chironomus tepperi]|uniref:pickpocket protein 28-like n=1 Tax=Chironomus tepperi TaxID=113505 RepID=UPI00391FB024
MKAPRKLIENISIHGIGYIFLEHVSRYTRVFWSLVVLTSIGGLLFNNYVLYQKFNEVPDINVRTRQVFSNKIPFPAITVCTPLFAKHHLGHIYNTSTLLLKKGKPEVTLNLSIEEQNYLASNIHACSPDLSINLKYHVENRTDKNILKLLNESSLTLSEALINCGFKAFVTDCSYVFNRVLTDRGFCYSFNLQSFKTIFNENIISSDFHSYKRSNIRKSVSVNNPLINEKLDDSNEVLKWSLDRGYGKDHQDDSVPIKAEKGKFFAFNPYLNESDTKNVCMQIGNIFSFYIHLPNEIMLPMHQEHYVEFKRKREITLAAKSYKVDEGLRKFPPKIRGCYFEGEKKLKFFKTYTKGLCEYECMTNYTLKECGCVKFSMPRTSDTPICSVDNAECYFNSMMKWPDYQKTNDMFEATCGCLKSCSEIKYEVKYDKISSSENVMFVYNIYNLSKA